MNENDVIEIDLLELFKALRKKAWALILVAMIGAGAAAAYAFLWATPIYESTAKLYITSQSTSLTSLADVQLGSQLAYDYQEMITSRTFISELKQNLGLDYSYKTISEGMVSVENPANTRILAISVQSEDPAEAKAMANELAQISRKNISEIMVTDEPTFFEKAIQASKPIKPEKTKLIVIGFMLGFLLAAAIVTIRFIVNDKLKSIEDVERLLQLPILASIPYEAEEATNKKKELDKLNKQLGGF